mmetsp:Transcript_331/g.571  ORF Transcript_331/g.571 Transcript_331/m.571 type:complete len:215 (-) Transcript_331:49-693(-)
MDSVDCYSIKFGLPRSEILWQLIHGSIMVMSKFASNCSWVSVRYWWTRCEEFVGTFHLITGDFFEKVFRACPNKSGASILRNTLIYSPDNITRACADSYFESRNKRDQLRIPLVPFHKSPGLLLIIHPQCSGYVPRRRLITDGATDFRSLPCKSGVDQIYPYQATQHLKCPMLERHSHHSTLQLGFITESIQFFPILRHNKFRDSNAKVRHLLK